MAQFFFSFFWLASINTDTCKSNGKIVFCGIIKWGLFIALEVVQFRFINNGTSANLFDVWCDNCLWRIQHILCNILHYSFIFYLSVFICLFMFDTFFFICDWKFIEIKPIYGSARKSFIWQNIFLRHYDDVTQNFITNFTLKYKF